MQNSAAAVSPARERDIRYDLLRCIALLCIILAHVDPPKWLFQLRNFDVPLMVVLSGAVFALSPSAATLSYGQYVKKRVLRLAVPVWIFYIIYFAASILVSVLFHIALPFTRSDVIGEFLFGGDGYSWIIGVFLMVALVAPFLWRARRDIGNDRRFLAGAICVMAVGQCLFLLWSLLPESKGVIASFIANNYIFEVIPYSCIFAFGMCVPFMKRATLAYWSLFFAFIFLFYAAGAQGFQLPHSLANVIWTQAYKYPAQLYFISYALAASFSLLFLFYKKPHLPESFSSLIVFVSTASLWIYLWHIFFLSFFKHVFPTDWRLQKYVLVVLLSVAITFVQYRITKAILARLSKKDGWLAFSLKFFVA